VSQSTLTYIGRILALTPVTLGAQFEEACTVYKTTQERPSSLNGWKRRTVVEPIRNWWRANHHETGELTFYTLAGYGPRIEYALRNQNLQVIDALPNGLGEPDFSLIAGTEFRGSQAEVLMRILTSRTGVVKCSTGWGKSFLCTKISRLFPKAKIVLTVSSIDIAKDYYQAMRVYDSTVGFVGDGSHNCQRVTVAVSHSLRHCDHEWTNLVLGDECHTLAAPSFVEALGAFRRAKFIGFSASPTGRTDKTDGMIEALFGPLIADVPYDEAVQTGNVVPITVLMVECPRGPSVDHLQDHHFERAAIWDNAVRNRLLAQINDYALKTFGADDQILTMVSKTEHAFRLQQLMPDYTVVHGGINAEKAASLQSAGALIPGQQVCTPKQRERFKHQFEKGEIQKAIATSVWSKGVNFQDLRYLVRGDALASAIESTQVPGRLSRLGTDKDKGMGYLFDTYDSFSPRLEGRSKRRITEYKKHGWLVKRISL
jgi:superfamily II DNA or RNA helicase